MLKRFLAAIGIGTASTANAVPGPYANDATNLIYQLLFCDNLGLFQKNHTGELRPPWTVLFNEKSSLADLQTLAKDETCESRVRILAFNALRARGEKVTDKILLGVIFEVGMPEGLDTLAAFSDGSARYINYTGKMAFVEGLPNPFQKEIREILDSSKSIVTAIGPWDKDRLLPPTNGMTRITFLVSDGLYFGQGPSSQMQQEQMASPVIIAGVKLLRKLTEKSTEQGAAANP
jgi:hypothetical protein